MSIKAVSWALELYISDMAAKLVLVALADFADAKTGECFPTIETLAKSASTSERTIQRKIALLTKWGYVEKLEIFDGGRQRANSYRLRFDAKPIPQDVEEGCQAVTLGEGDTAVTRGGDTAVTPGGDTAVTPLKRTVIGTVINTQEGGSVEWEDFSRVYAPRLGEDQIGMSRKAWRELSPTEQAEAVRHASAYCRKQQRSGIRPLLSSEYLRQRAWRSIAPPSLAPVAVEWVEEGSARWRELIASGKRESFMRAQLVTHDGKPCFPHYAAKTENAA